VSTGRATEGLPARPRADVRVGLQLWTVREQVAADLPAALAAVREAGFREVELAGFAGHAPAALRDALAASGLAAVSAHVSYSMLRDDLDGVIGRLATVGCPAVVVPAFAAELVVDLARVQALAGALDGIGRRLVDAGLSFALHNEDGQHAPIGCTTPWEVLVAATDPSVVALQLDVFTLVGAGLDPSDVLRRHGERVTSLHACDRRAGRYVPVGAGEIDWAPILGGLPARCRHLFVEDEDPTDPVGAARASLLGLRRLLGPWATAPD
jgi:sugar phosphate isomerase/epimerase